MKNVDETAMDRLIEEYISQDSMAHAVTASDIILPKRPEYSHKGTFGKLLIIGGSVGYTGAPAMAAMSAQRGGAGLVFVGVPQAVYPIEAQKLLEPMPFPLDCDESGRISLSAEKQIEARLKGMSALLIGPGMGFTDDTSELTRRICYNAKIPVILDADGINAFSSHINMLDGHGRCLILTPHEGEFKRLGGDMKDGRVKAARTFATEHGCVLVLKGHRTVTAFPDGEVLVNMVGNSGMAKGGSGDVLAGLIASFIAQNMDVKTAVPAAVYICSTAADLLAERMTEYCILPGEVINAIPEVMKKLKQE